MKVSAFGAGLIGLVAALASALSLPPLLSHFERAPLQVHLIAPDTSEGPRADFTVQGQHGADQFLVDGKTALPQDPLEPGLHLN